MMTIKMRQTLSSNQKITIEEILEREMDSSGLHSVDSFVGLSNQDMMDLSLLWVENWQLCLDYLEFLLKEKESLSMRMSFCSSVLEQRMLVEEWVKWKQATGKMLS